MQRNSKNLRKAEILRRGGKNTQNYFKNVFMTQITMMVWSLILESDILESEIKWALGSITLNKASEIEFQLSYFKS